MDGMSDDNKFFFGSYRCTFLDAANTASLWRHLTNNQSWLRWLKDSDWPRVVCPSSSESSIYPYDLFLNISWLRNWKMLRTPEQLVAPGQHGCCVLSFVYWQSLIFFDVDWTSSQPAAGHVVVLLLLLLFEDATSIAAEEGYWKECTCMSMRRTV